MSAPLLSESLWRIVEPLLPPASADRPEPDRPRKARHKASLITDRRGIPLAFPPTGANVYDSIPFENPRDAVPPAADKLHSNKAYDHRRRSHPRNRRPFKTRIDRQGIDRSQKLG